MGIDDCVSDGNWISPRWKELGAGYLGTDERVARVFDYLAPIYDGESHRHPVFYLPDEGQPEPDQVWGTAQAIVQALDGGPQRRYSSIYEDSWRELGAGYLAAGERRRLLFDLFAPVGPGGFRRPINLLSRWAPTPGELWELVRTINDALDTRLYEIVAHLNAALKADQWAVSRLFSQAVRGDKLEPFFVCLDPGTANTTIGPLGVINAIFEILGYGLRIHRTVDDNEEIQLFGVLSHWG